MVNPAIKKGPRFRFIGETIAELKKAVWLSRREAVYLTALVLVVAAFPAGGSVSDSPGAGGCCFGGHCTGSNRLFI